MAFSIDQTETVAVGKIKLQIGKKKDANMGMWKKDGLIYLILTTEDRSELLEYTRPILVTKTIFDLTRDFSKTTWADYFQTTRNQRKRII